jgi:hypothetical protein
MMKTGGWDNEVDEDTIDVADLSQLINVNIFSFAYGKLRKTINHFWWR